MSASRCSTILLVFFALTAPSTAQPGGTKSDTPPRRAKATAALNRLPLAFVENRGQWHTEARFVARRGGLTARLETDALVLQVEGEDQDETVRGAVVRLAFGGCEKNARLIGEKRQPGRYNYFLGNNRDKWRTGVPAYGSVLYRGLYDGIDVRVREGDGRILEYDVLVEPGADLGQVVVRCTGAENLRLTEDGSLIIKTAVGDVRMKPPASWEENPAHEKTPIDVRYRLLGTNRFTFEAPARRLDLALVIDPGLVWSTFLGGAGKNDVVSSVAIDAQGAVTVAGWTDSPTFPTTPGAFDTTHNGGADAFVARLSPSGTSLHYSTFFGGKYWERASALAIDARGAATIAGGTDSPDLPITNGAYQSTHSRGAGGDAFVARLSPNGSSLVYSTFLGMSQPGGEAIGGVALDARGGAMVLGSTRATNFPTTRGAFDTTHNGGRDIFVTRLDPSLIGAAQLTYSTFLGGSVDDSAGALALDASGVITVAGNTLSTNFPTTPGAFDTTHNGGADAFVSRLDPSKSGTAQLIYSTLLGGTGGDNVQDLSVDATGVVTVAGYTYSTDYPWTSNAYRTALNGNIDAIVSRLDPSLIGTSQLTYSTFLGGSGGDVSRALSVDTSGVITVAGDTASTDYPTTLGAHDTTFNGGADAIVSRLDPSKSGTAQLVYSTFLGGGGTESVNSLVIDAQGAVTVAGWTDSPTFPTTPGAYDTSHNGRWAEPFVTRLAITCLSGAGTSKPGTTVTLAVSAPGDAGLVYQLGSSLGTGPIQIGSRKLGLSPDNLLVVSVNGWWASIFSSYQGVIGTNGQANAAVNIPNFPLLVGNTVHTAFVTVSPSAPQGIKSISNTYSFQIVP